MSGFYVWPSYEGGLVTPVALGAVLADMTLLVECSKTFEVAYLRAKLAKLDREIRAEA